MLDPAGFGKYLGQEKCDSLNHLITCLVR
jgi:hypothetical protein